MQLQVYISPLGRLEEITIDEAEIIAGIYLRLWQQHFRDNPAFSGFALFASERIKAEPTNDLHGRALDSIHRMKPVSTGASISTLKDTSDLSLVHLVLAPWHYDLPSQPANSDIWNYDVAGWQVAKDGSYHEFLAHWRGRSFDDGERILTLGPEARGLNFPVFSIEGNDTGQILVLDSYKRIFARVVLLQKASVGGVNLTGQPGTGKTTCLMYFLVRLLSAGEDVALYMDNKTTLFYRNCVYRPIENFPSLPRKSPESPIWCLLDCNKDRPPPSFLVGQNNCLIFPVQASSTGSDTTAIRKRGVIRLGMPLWTQDEVIEGFKLYRKYPALVKEIRRLLQPHPHEEVNIKFGRVAVRAALEISRETSFAEIEDVDSRVDTILKELVIRTVGKCDAVPGPVYNDIFWQTFQRDVDDALNQVSYDAFVDALVELSTSGVVSSSLCYIYNIVATTPRYTIDNEFVSDTFVPKFRNQAIGRDVIAKVGPLQPEDARRLIFVYRLNPACPVLLEWLFAGIAHGTLSLERSTFWPSGRLIPMLSRPVPEAGMLQFHTLPSLFHGACEISGVHFGRWYTAVEFVENQLKWPPTARPQRPFDGSFCVPQGTDNTLFNAFVVQLLESDICVTPIIWIFQTTVAMTCNSSSAGYPLVRAIKAWAEEQTRALYSKNAGDTDPIHIIWEKTPAMRKQKRPVTRELCVKAAELKYVLVCPVPESEEDKNRIWNFPVTDRDGTEGSFYCQFLKDDQLSGIRDF